MSERIGICLGYPAYLAPGYADRLRSIDPRIEAIALPVDADSDWVTVSPAEPHEEPPAWGRGVAEARREALARSEVLIALHTPRELMRLAPGLRWIQGVGAGVEQFALAGVPQGRVRVTNASGVSSGSMAEFVMGRLLQIWKRFAEIDEHQRTHRYVQTYGRTFAGSTLGIIGMGSIGCAVAERAGAFGARILGLKRTPGGRAAELADALYPPERLHELLGACDAVVIAAPATDETHHLIDEAALACLPAGAVLVNVARGSLIDEAALVRALEAGQLGAAVLDVFDAEPLPAESPLWDLPGAFLSAHSSVSVDRYLDDVFDLFADNVTRYVAGQALRNLVDMAALGFRED
jgi:phosphoglycerate dehydrogenase-like enzyme